MHPLIRARTACDRAQARRGGLWVWLRAYVPALATACVQLCARCMYAHVCACVFVACLLTPPSCFSTVLRMHSKIRRSTYRADRM